MSISKGEELFFASRYGNKEIVETLIKNGADVNHECAARTPLFLASRDGNKEIVETLIKNGADVNHESGDKWTALSWASYHGHKEIVEILIKNGANVNYECGDKEIIKEVLEKLERERKERKERKERLTFLLCSRKICNEFLLSEEKLPLDLFKQILFFSDIIENPFENKRVLKEGRLNKNFFKKIREKELIFFKILFF